MTHTTDHNGHLSSIGENGKSTVYSIFLALVIALMILPIWMVSVLPWEDYACHLGRVYVLAHYSDVPAFQHYYTITYALLPNLAIDLIATPLALWFGPYVAGKLFASVLVILFALGMDALGRSLHGRFNWLTIPASFLLYNTLLFGGFVNYMFSIAMMLLASAAWVRFDSNPTVRSGVMTTILAFVTYLSHISGFVCLCIFIGTCVADRVICARAIQKKDALAFLPLTPGAAAYASLGERENTFGAIKWASLADKVKSLWVPFNSYSVWVDLLVLLALIFSALLVWRYGWVAWDRRGGLATVVFGFAYLLFPFEIRTGNQADVRFLVPALAVAAAAVSIRISRRWGHVAFAVLVLIFAVRILDTTRAWLRADQISREQRALLNRIPENSSVFPVILLPEDRAARKIRWQLIHLADYTTIDRHAFSGSMMTHVGQQPIRRRTESPYADYGTSRSPISIFPWRQITASYAYVWTYEPPPQFVSYLDSNFDLVARAGMGRVYKVRTSTLDSDHVEEPRVRTIHSP